MESSDAETGMVDCGVGTIVWVRRRNGSWWPGKILGPDELSASHLMSPRSGTPVKLLGREDASVDWYNLEKSKRVKPFRCGEFDDCIERAEASQGMPPKKREKYARREDAILHALELEKQLLEKKNGKSGIHSNGLGTKLLGKDTIVTPEISCDNGKYANTAVEPSLEEKRRGLSFVTQRADGGSQLNVDDKSPDVRPRLRGLQDLGVGPIPLKYKISPLTDSNGSHKHHAAANADLHDLTPESSKKLLEKRKRSQEGNIEETMNKRRDRRRPLVQVLKSSAKLPHTHPLQLRGDGGGSLCPGEELADTTMVGNEVKSRDGYYDHAETLPDQMEISIPKFEKRVDSFTVGGLSEENTTGSNEDTETDSSGTESLISDMSDAMAALSDEGEHIEFIPKAAFGRCEVQGEHDSMSDDSGVRYDSGDSVALATSTVSKWQLKGKRNSRRYPERKISMSATQWMGSFKEEETSYNDDSNTRSQVMTAYGYGPLSSSINWEEPWELSVDPLPAAATVYVSHHFGGMMKGGSMLIDVDVGVQSGYQREHVPMISLMSKLNDKAIVGHPIPIETLEDSSSDIIILSASASASAADDESLAHDSTLQPWRTARRTAKCRVPRLSTLEEEEEEEYVADEDGKGNVNRKSKKLLKRAQRKTTSSCNQKIRTLSSIGGSHHNNHQQQQSTDMECYKGEGRVMKPESLPTAVACIPVKLVFSRLHEELVARHQ